MGNVTGGNLTGGKRPGGGGSPVGKRRGGGRRRGGGPPDTVRTPLPPRFTLSIRGAATLTEVVWL